MPEKNQVLKLCPKMLLASEISAFFNRQYFINESASDFDFSNVGRHEWQEQGLLMGVWKEKKIQGK